MLVSAGASCAIGPPSQVRTGQNQDNDNSSLCAPGQSAVPHIHCAICDLTRDFCRHQPHFRALRFPLSAYILLFSYLIADIVMPNGYNPLFSHRQVHHSQPSSRVRPHLSSTKFLTAPIAPCLHPRAFPHGPSAAGAAPRCEGSGHQWMANTCL